MWPKMHHLTRRGAVLGLFAAGLSIAFLAWAQQWLPLAEDGLHHPDSAAVEILQQPSEALSLLPADTAGNLVRWVEALEAGVIGPRASACYGLAIAHEELGDLPEAMGAMRTYLHLAPPGNKHQARARAALWEWETDGWPTGCLARRIGTRPPCGAGCWTRRKQTPTAGLATAPRRSNPWAGERKNPPQTPAPGKG